MAGRFSRWIGVALSLGVGVSILCCGECVVRHSAPQDPHLSMVQGTSLALPDPVLGLRNRPGAIAIQSSPEYHARYEINEQGLRDATVYGTVPPAGTMRVLLV